MPPAHPIRRKALIALLAIFLLVTACRPAQTNDLPPATGKEFPPPTSQPTEPDLLPPTTQPTETNVPPNGRLPAAPSASSPALTTYLPGQADLPDCFSTYYMENLGNSSDFFCETKDHNYFHLLIFKAAQPKDKSKLSVSSEYQTKDVVQIGEATVLGVKADGKRGYVEYVRGNWYNTGEMIVDEGQINVDELVVFMQIADKLIPADAPFPGSIAFPEHETKGKLKTYFSELSLSMVKFENNQQVSLEVRDGLPEEAWVCLNVTPVRKSRDYFSVALYDVQKQEIVRKISYEMYPQKICGLLQVLHDSADPFKAGLKYELRIAVGEDWIATLPYVTK